MQPACCGEAGMAAAGAVLRSVTIMAFQGFQIAKLQLKLRGSRLDIQRQRRHASLQCGLRVACGAALQAQTTEAWEVWLLLISCLSHLVVVMPIYKGQAGRTRVEACPAARATSSRPCSPSW